MKYTDKAQLGVRLWSPVLSVCNLLVLLPVQ